MSSRPDTELSDALYVRPSGYKLRDYVRGFDAVSFCSSPWKGTVSLL